MPKAMITGGAGFIGRSVIRFLLEGGSDIVAFDRGHALTFPSIQHCSGCVADPEAIEPAAKDVDVIFHLAGLLGTTELLFMNVEAVKVNVLGTVNVLEAARKHQVKRVFYPTKPNKWLNTYSITKKAGEDFARMYAQIWGLDVRILRWLNVYGPGQKICPVRKAVPLMIVQGLHDRDIEVFGSGMQDVHLVYVDDVVRSTVLYTSSNCGDAAVRDTGNIVTMTVSELAEMVRRITGSRGGIRHLPMRRGEDPESLIELLPDRTAADILGLSERTMPIENGLARTVDYYARLPSEARENALSFHEKGGETCCPAF